MLTRFPIVSPSIVIYDHFPLSFTLNSYKDVECLVFIKGLHHKDEKQFNLYRE